MTNGFGKPAGGVQRPSMSEVTSKITGMLAQAPDGPALQTQNDDPPKEAGVAQPPAGAAPQVGQPGGRQQGAIGKTLKKPAAAAKPTKKNILKRPAARPNHVVWSGPGKPPVPTIGQVIIYKHPKIYVSAPRRCFRILVDAKNYASEKQEPLGSPEPTAASWRKTLKRCDERNSPKTKQLVYRTASV